MTYVSQVALSRIDYFNHKCYINCKMSEKQKVSYDWKKESLSKNEILNSTKKRARYAMALLALSVALNVELLTDHKPSKMILDFIDGDKAQEQVESPDFLGSTKITIDDGETLQQEATEATKELAGQHQIDVSTLDYQAIQEQSRNAQQNNNESAVSYPDDEYVVSLSKNISGLPETKIEPVKDTKD